MNNIITLKIGSSLPHFKLEATDGKTYSGESFKNKKILVVMFTCNHCPYVRAYEDRLIKLQEDYKEKGVSFIAINPNDDEKYPEDSIENMIKRTKEKGFNFPYLRDKSQEVAKLFGASYTPEIFVFDENRILQYHGRIDDNWQEPDKVTKRNLKDAIEALLNKMPIERKDTQAIGCTVKWS